jgi:hypothetical protein
VGVDVGGRGVEVWVTVVVGEGARVDTVGGEVRTGLDVEDGEQAEIKTKTKRAEITQRHEGTKEHEGFLKISS